MLSTRGEELVLPYSFAKWRSGADWKWSRSRPRVNGFGPTMVCDSVLCELCVLCPDPTPDIGTTFTGRIEGDRFVLGERGTPSGHGVEDAFEPC